MRAKLPALEKNILKYRALQMVLLLHQVESLRSFLICSIRCSDKFASITSMPILFQDEQKRPMEKALEILVSKAIISEKESKDLQDIISLRNDIGHRIHELVSDISYPERGVESDKVYDYFALDRFERYRDKISRGMMKHFVLVSSFRDITFEQAEATYKEELRRLRKRIERQREIRIENCAALSTDTPC